MKQPLRFARHLRLIVVAYLMFTSDFTVVAQQTPSALTGRKTISGIVLDIETDQPIVGAQVWLKDTTIYRFWAMKLGKLFLRPGTKLP